VIIIIIIKTENSSDFFILPTVSCAVAWGYLSRNLLFVICGFSSTGPRILLFFCRLEKL